MVIVSARRIDGAAATCGCPSAIFAFLSLIEAEALGQAVAFAGDFAVPGTAAEVVGDAATAGAVVADAEGTGSACLPPPKRPPSQSSRPGLSSSVVVGDGLGLGAAEVAPPVGAGWVPVLVFTE